MKQKNQLSNTKKITPIYTYSDKSDNNITTKVKIYAKKPQLPDEIVDNSINDVKHYFTDHALCELLQRGISKYPM